MSEENIKITVIIKGDIRNPLSKLVFRDCLGADYDRTLYSERAFQRIPF